MTIRHAAALLALFAGMPTAAQTSYGYAFAAAGRETGYSGYFHAGIGGDWIIGRGFGLGAEVGGVTGRRPGAPNVALISGNGSYNVALADSAYQPFVTGGITLVTAGGSGDVMPNWGAGLNWWIRPRFGARFEFRDHVWTSASRHLLDFRLGVAFR
jgi:hypothetical protein